MAVRLKIEGGIDNDPQYKAKTLRARAEALARPVGKSEKDEACSEVVEFFLAHEQYCFELIHIREVYPLKAFTPLPCTPPFVLGIMNFRGQILSIIDLKKIFGLPDQAFTDMSRIIILHSNEMEFGILADSITGVKTIPLSEIKPLPESLAGTGTEYIRGVTEDHVMILDGKKILSDKSLVVHQGV